MRFLATLALTVTALALMASPAMAQRFGGPGGPGGGFLLANKSVQEELKLTEDQVKKVQEANQQLMAKAKEEFAKIQELPEDERRAKFQELAKKRTEETNKAAADILKPDQAKRYKQIQLQVRGPDAFADEQVAKDLKLTDDQKDKIKTIMEDFRRDSQGIFQGVDFTDQEARQAAMKKMQTLRKETAEKLTGLLTDDQKKSWTELTGKPFEIKFEPQRRPAGQRGKRGNGDKKKEI